MTRAAARTARAAGAVKSFVKRSMRDRAAHSFDAARRAPERPGGPTWGSHHPNRIGLDLSRSGPAGKGGGARDRNDPGPHRRSTAYRNELISIVSVRPGPTPIAEIGAPDISSRAFT
ncbi:hypothetical protein SCMC78_32890 [Streptomyces sp. CMC78]|uniref:Uncharacterized protein n=1 Tax=Streptomyces sp. CMC78 TaxID=3231512 RepID=A0AB33KLR3_9ACTN